MIACLEISINRHFYIIIRHPGHCSRYRSKAWESKNSNSFFSCSIVACALKRLHNTKCDHPQKHAKAIQQTFVAVIAVSASPSFLLMLSRCVSGLRLAYFPNESKTMFPKPESKNPRLTGGVVSTSKTKPK